MNNSKPSLMRLQLSHRPKRAAASLAVLAGLVLCCCGDDATSGPNDPKGDPAGETSCMEQMTPVSGYAGDGVAFKMNACLFGQLIDVTLTDGVLCGRDYSVDKSTGTPNYAAAELVDAAVEIKFAQGAEQLAMDLDFEEVDLANAQADTEIAFPDQGVMEASLTAGSSGEQKAVATAGSQLLLKKFEGRPTATGLPQTGVFAGFLDATFAEGRLTASFHAVCEPAGED